jgi:hypothetical protein
MKTATARVNQKSLEALNKLVLDARPNVQITRLASFEAIAWEVGRAHVWHADLPIAERDNNDTDRELYPIIEGR